MILNAYGLVDVSPLQVSEMLRTLNLSHTFVGGSPTTHTTIDGLCVEQPLWPVVIDRVRNVPKVTLAYPRLIYLVCDGRGPLELCNVRKDLWPDQRQSDLSEALARMLVSVNEIDGEPWSLQLNERTIDSYVEEAAKPSFLNFLHQKTCKITPYSPLRKNVQKDTVAYLASGLSLTAFKREYKHHMKVQDVLDLIDSPDALNLRQAVVEARRRPNQIEQIAEEFDVQEFEIRYVTTAYAKNKAS